MNKKSVRIVSLGLAWLVLLAGSAWLQAADNAAKPAPVKPGPALNAPAPMGANDDDPYADKADDANPDALEEPTADTLDKEIIGGVVSKRMTGIRSCYETELQTNQKLKGVVAVTFTIELKGGVTGVQIIKDKTNLTDKKVVECVLKQIKQLQFPARKSGEPQTVNYPFRFQPMKDKN